MTFMDDEFEFSYWKKPIYGRTVPFTFDEFRFNSAALSGLLKSITETDCYVAIANNMSWYEALDKNQSYSSINDALSQCKQNSIKYGKLTEFSKGDWHSATAARFAANPHNGSVTLTFPRIDHPDKLIFKGQRVSGSVYDEIMDMFHKEGELYVISGSKTRLTKSRSLN